MKTNTKDQKAKSAGGINRRKFLTAFAAVAAIPIHGLRLPQGALAFSGVEAPEKS